MYSTERGTYLTLLTGVTVLMMMVIFFVISLFRQHARRIKEIKGQVLRDMTLIEEERKRISADLHDDLGSSMAAMYLSLQNLSEVLPANKMLETTLGNLERSQSKIKQIAHNLLPGILLSRGLLAAVDELAQEIRASKKLKILVDNMADDRSFMPSKSIIVFRVIQEIVTNALKHAEATGIYLEISTDPNRLCIKIRDNGKGFQISGLTQGTRRLGIKNIRSRLELLNAEYKLQSSPGNGTSYLIEIPIITMTTDDEKSLTR